MPKFWASSSSTISKNRINEKAERKLRFFCIRENHVLGARDGRKTDE